MNSSNFFFAAAPLAALRSFIVAASLGAAVTWAQAGFLPFTATVDGQSQIVDVLNPTGPVVRVQTQASGAGSIGPLDYHSSDVLDLATGQGTGSNRFVSADGDELFGSFSVQMLPGADASLFDLIGQVLFTGGTGSFLGASGVAGFIGRGQFISASLALTHFEFNGRLATVPEPGSGWLAAVALAIGWAGRARAGRPRAGIGKAPALQRAA